MIKNKRGRGRHSLNRKRNNMREFPHDKIRGRLLRKGWTVSTIDGTMLVGEEEIAVQTEVYSHESLGNELSLEDANIAQKARERHLKETFDERASEYLEEKGWTQTENGQWYIPNWNPVVDAKQRERFEAMRESMTEKGVEFDLNPGCYASLRKAYKIQLKLDQAPEVEGLEETLEDLMLMTPSGDFGA